MFIPPINGPLEELEYLKWLRDREVAQERLNTEFISFIERARASDSTSASQVAAVNLKTRDLANAVESVEGLPPGGVAGDTLRTDRTGAARRWMPNFAGTTPRLYVHLEDGAPTYEWDVYFHDRETMLPEVVFYDDGRSLEVVSWGPETSLFPINYDIQVEPHSDGETFEIRLPSGPYSIGSGEINNFNITIHNSWVTGFTADVVFGGSVFLFGGFKQFYKDSRVAPWRVDVGPNYENRAVLPSGDQIAWFVEQSPTFENHLTPVLTDTLDDLDRSITFPRDFYYWRYVQSLRRADKFFTPGVLTVSPGNQVAYNDSVDSRRIGLVRASVATAPTGASLQLNVQINGVNITSTPVTIPAGSTTVSVEPDAYTHGPGGVNTTADPIGGDSVIWFPGQYITFDVTQVGSTVAGSDLTVQVWAG